MDFVDIKKLPLAERLKRMDERKFSFSPFVSVVFFPTNTTFNSLGLTKNIYAGFDAGISLGIGSDYKLNKRISITTDVSLIHSTKKFYTMNIFGLNAGAKYFIFGSTKRISPFVGGGINFTLLNINQQQHISKITATNEIAEIQFGTPTEIGYRHIDLSVLYGPLAGIFLSAGADIKINGKYSFVLQAIFNPSFTSPKITEYFPGNISELQHYSFRGGLNVKLFKLKPPEIDTNQIYIPDDITAFDMNEDHNSGRMMVREGVFDIILREGLMHKVKLSVGDFEILMDEEVADNCNVNCYLYDENGDVLMMAVSNAEGKIVFSDIKNGIYDLVFVLEKPCKTANFKYKFPNPNTFPLLQYNEEGSLSDSLQYNIDGIIQVPDSLNYNFIYNNSALFVKDKDKLNKKNYDITVMLSDDNDEIIKHFDPKKDEKFAFKKLKPGMYDVIYRTPDVELHAGYKFTIFDNFKKPLKNIDLNSSCDSVMLKNSSITNPIKYTMKGKVTFLDSLLKPEDVTLYLVNCFKKIESTKMPNADGTFTFVNLHSKNDYKVYYELKNPSANIDLMYKIDDPALAYKLAKDESIIEIKVINGDMQLWNINTEYDINGSVIKPKGYALQVAASDDIKSINSICKRLMDDGFGPISIQVQGTENLNKRFAFSKSFKIFKVVVGNYEAEKEAISQKYKLEFFGFDAYVMKHLP